MYLVRQLRQCPRPVRAGPGSRLGQTLRPGIVHPRRRLQRRQVVERYAIRWSIEPSNAVGKQQMGVGQARNRVKNAVERTVPFGMLTQSLVIVWYTLYGHHPDDVVIRRQAQPWYDAKAEPSFEDMLTKLRKALIAARFSAVAPVRSTLTYCATTLWPAPQPPRNSETRAANEGFNLCAASAEA